MIVYLLFGAAVALFVYAFHAWATFNSAYFELHQPKLPALRPTFLLGTTGSMKLNREHMDTWVRWLYGALPDARMVGIFDFRQPMFMLRDPELIKQVSESDAEFLEL